MRMTTKIIQNNSLTNINNNKLMQDKLSQQMSTEKKVNRPSDDPIVAIRALRLRTNVNQVTQYYEKNVPDAESWLSVTEGALSSMSEVITDMIKQSTKGSNEDLTSADRETILTAMRALRDEVYSTGNSDYAGRYIFTGYRTDTALTFTEDCTKDYEIIEQVDNSVIDTLTHVTTGDILKLNENNYQQDPQDKIVEQDVERTQVNRLRLSYGNVNALAAGSDPQNYSIQIWDNGGYKDITQVDTAFSYKSASIYDEPSTYDSVGDDDIVLVKETGEVLLGSNVYDKLMSLRDDPSTQDKEGEIRVTYKKDKWEDGDLRPEHYFACKETITENGVSRDISYNQEYLQGIEDKQSIEYDVGLNQTIRVNTTADEAFSHAISRDVEDLITSMENTVAMEKQVAKINDILEKTEDPARIEVLEKQLAAAEKAFTFLKENTQQLFEGSITKMQGHLDAVNFAVTENGTRGQKLDLISNRLMSQKTNFETLRSDNEDIDITDVAIKLSSAELTYSSALMATGKVLQSNLMNFI